LGHAYWDFGGTVNEGTIDDVVDEARQAEVDGFESYWAPNIFGHDALTALAIVGREVPRIELGTSVVPTFPRHPMAIAQQCLTVSAACEGRLTLGIGLSHKVVIENMMGMSYDKPIRHIRDYLSILGPLSRNEGVRYSGEAYTTFGAITAKGAPPFSIVVAALGPQMLKVTAELADGTLTWCTGPTTLGDYVAPTINAAAEAAERPAPRVIAALPSASQMIRRPPRVAPQKCLRSTARYPATERCSTARELPGRKILRSPDRSRK
jgi:5,10-methylenetetrahydromethanopterin reductase